MSPGAKLFLTLAALGVTGGVLALAASKKANAAPLPPKHGDGGTVVVPPHPDLPPTVTPSEPEGGFDRSGPFAVPGIQDAAEASRLILRWWAAEGQSLVSGDTAPDRPKVARDFGSRTEDLNGSFGPRTQQAAAAFEHYNGLTPEDGVLSNPLLLALRRWAESQQLPPEALPPKQSPATPLPIVLPSAPPATQPSTPIAVPLPPIMPQTPPVVPVPPFIPQQQQPAQQTPPTVQPPVVAPTPLPPGPVPLPPVLTIPQTPPASPAEAPTTVSKDTAAMVNALLTREAKDGWNTIDPSVQAWQKSRGLKTDGLFGPKSALAVAEEFGTVPIIRVWPKASQKAPALQAYRASLIEIANHSTDPTRAAQLRVSAQREQAQGFGPKQGKAPALPPDLRVTIAKV
jgi:peptidoglycan hydrolase-like protein with peptidoglycan-binding domain